MNVPFVSMIFLILSSLLSRILSILAADTTASFMKILVLLTNSWIFCLAAAMLMEFSPVIKISSGLRLCAPAGQYLYTCEKGGGK